MRHELPITVLLIEDNLYDIELMAEMLAETSSSSFKLTSVQRLSEAIECIAQEAADVVLLDLSLPDSHGFETFRKFQRQTQDVPVVVLTGLNDEDLAIRAVQEGAQDYLVKSQVDSPLLRHAIRHAIERQRLRVELGKKNQQLRTSKRRLEVVLDSTGDAIAMFDVKGGLLFANQWYERLFELTGERLQEMSASQLREHAKSYFQEPTTFEETESTFFDHPEQEFEDVIEIRRPQRKMLYRFTAPMKDDEGNLVGRILVYRDISKEIEIQQMNVEVLRLRAELELKYTFENIIGNSQKMRELYALMQQAIESNITTLILGESGTGKELVAKAIHFNSSRKKGPFVAVNCAAIPEALIESELFGHERGAFTGATMRRIGRFEQSKGGTIFLDEITEMHPSVQAKLLRVLAEREIQRVGGTTTIPIDVRVIAATNRGLEEAIKAGEFREDLFYRLAAFPIVVPPLKQRRDDVPLLVEHFLKKCTQATNKSIKGISPQALNLLMRHDWPGNVRELENLVERAVLLEQSNVLQAGNPAIKEPYSHSAPQMNVSVPEVGDDPVPQHTNLSQIDVRPIKELEKQAIVHALKATKNNVEHAARLLGLGRATLYRKLKTYNVLENE